MTIVSKSSIERHARAMAEAGATLEESQPYPPGTEHADLFEKAFKEAEAEAA